MELPPWAQHTPSLFYHLRCQRNIARDHQVTRAESFDNFVIRGIEATGYLKKFNQGRWGYAHRLICHKGQLHSRALSCSE